MRAQRTNYYLLFLFVILTTTNYSFAQGTVKGNGNTKQKQTIVSAKEINGTKIQINFSNKQKMLIDFYGNNIFRMFQDNNGGEMRSPEAKPPAEILVDSPRKSVSGLSINQTSDILSIKTKVIELIFDKSTTTFELKNLKTNQVVTKSISPIIFEEQKVKIHLNGKTNEYYYGGGVQNGRFSHKGKIIDIENQNSWTDGGVASPKPFYWSTNGYGFMWYSFKKGAYDFGSKNKNEVNLSHETNYLDVFFMVSDGAVALLNDYYQLTGKPVFIPKFGFYEGHLNAYNRDFWKEDEKGILFEDGKRYKESQKDNGGIKESLNGEKDNYQFSARAVVDRYLDNDFPLGWILPNDGYGAGYGQTSTLDSNIANLKELGDYTRKRGVEIGLWTQSDLHPVEGVEALLQRDIKKEVGEAGVRVLKTDVAWVGAGYSFGLNGIHDASGIMEKEGNKARPFIISLDGWAGTQRYATIWSGDQTGGHWEYIRFHIPTYIGAGLSGQPNICSDMDGIFGGKNIPVNTRDFQWKTFTLMQLNMDGWGSNEKYPQALGEPATSINRTYLKLKSELLPYAYSIAYESVHGLPSMRAMFLEEANPYTLGKSSQYQYMFGDYFLVAPIYQDTRSDKEGNDVRNHIYLPEGSWVDYFTGEVYEGGRVINNFDAPLWKLPVFVKRGAIIPRANPNNNLSQIEKDNRIYELYPYGKSSFVEYDDDGRTTDYMRNEFTKTLIRSNLSDDLLTVTVDKTKGNFEGFISEKSTEFRINLSKSPKNIIAKIGGEKLNLRKVSSIKEFESNTNVYFYNSAPNLNKFATKGSEFEKKKLIKNPVLFVKIEKTNTTQKSVELVVSGYNYNTTSSLLTNSGNIGTKFNLELIDSNITAYTLKPTWGKVKNADYYEIMFENMLYSNIVEQELLFENLEAETKYSFKLRAINKKGKSDWVTISETTKPDPLQHAIRGAVAESTAEMQGSAGAHRLFDFDERTMMHTKYYKNSVPFELVIDLKSVNNLDKISYVPRANGTNGIFTKGKVLYSMDKTNWTDAGSFEWKLNNEPKTFVLKEQPKTRYVKMMVDEAKGGYGSGLQMYLFKVPGTESFIPGDINKDGAINNNDLTSYMNYTGLRKGDSDFGYVSVGDVNNNGLIDSYDISNVATQLDGGISNKKIDKLSGELKIVTAKKSYKAGEEVQIKVEAKNLKAVNAFSFALPYDATQLEYIGITGNKTKEMKNLTYNRLHTNGDRVLYPTYVNIGSKSMVETDGTLITIKFKAKKDFNFNLKLTKGLLVDKYLNVLEF